MSARRVRNEAEVVDPFAASGSTAGTRRGRLWTAGLLGAWALLTAGLCDLIAEQLPDKPLPIAAGAVVLAGLGALLGLAVNTERRAADRRLRSELGRASKMLRSVEAITEPEERRGASRWTWLCPSATIHDWLS